jgi:hypothetical protein
MSSLLAEFTKADMPSKEEMGEEKEDDGEKHAPGFFAKLLTRIVDNIQIFVNRVHIRYEGLIRRFLFRLFIVTNFFVS